MALETVRLSTCTKAKPLSAGYGEVLAGTQSATWNYQTSKASAVNSVQTWCKGLLDVFDTPDSDDNGTPAEYHNTNRPQYGNMSRDSSPKRRSLTTVKFMHRSIPDYLLSIIREKASDQGFDDNDVAEGILIALVAETSASGIEAAYPVHILVQYIRHASRLLRLRSIPHSTGIFQLLQELEIARFKALQRICGPYYRCAEGIPGCPNYRRPSFPPWPNQRPPDPMLAGTQQHTGLSIDMVNHCGISTYHKHEMHLECDLHSTVLALASHSGLHEYVQWKFPDSYDQGQSPLGEIQ